MEYDSRLVAIDQIERENITHRFSEPEDIDGLAEKSGLLILTHPPIIVPNGSQFLPIAGHRTLDAAEASGMQAVHCRILAGDTTPVAIARVAISSRLQRGPMDICQTAKAVSLLATCTRTNAERIALAQTCGISMNAAMLGKLDAVAKMPGMLKKGVAEGTIALPVALYLFDLDNTDSQSALIELLRALDLSLNRQRELIDWINAICKRDGLGVNQLLAEPDIARGLRSRESDTKQKAAELRRHLHRRRFPAITAFEHRYQRVVGALNLQKGTKLMPPPHFEGETYTIALTFDSPQQLEQKHAELSQLLQSDTLKQLWTIME